MPKPLTLLYADDDPDDLSLVADVLNEVAPHSRFIPARDGQAALDILSDETLRPDLIVLDLNMPRLNGRECLLQLKMSEALRGIPVIMYTTSSQSRDIEATLMGGAAGFITKPVSVQETKNIFGQLVRALPHQLHAALRRLSETANTFIVC